MKKQMILSVVFAASILTSVAGFAENSCSWTYDSTQRTYTLTCYDLTKKYVNQFKHVGGQECKDGGPLMGANDSGPWFRCSPDKTFEGSCTSLLSGDASTHTAKLSLRCKDIDSVFTISAGPSGTRQLQDFNHDIDNNLEITLKNK